MGLLSSPEGLLLRSIRCIHPAHAVLEFPQAYPVPEFPRPARSVQSWDEHNIWNRLAVAIRWMMVTYCLGAVVLTWKNLWEMILKISELVILTLKAMGSTPGFRSRKIWVASYINGPIWAKPVPTLIAIRSFDTHCENQALMVRVGLTCWTDGSWVLGPECTRGIWSRKVMKSLPKCFPEWF